MTKTTEGSEVIGREYLARMVAKISAETTRADEATALLEQSTMELEEAAKMFRGTGLSGVGDIMDTAAQRNRAWLDARKGATLNQPMVDPLLEALEAVEHLRFLQDHLCTNPLSTEAFIKTFAELVDEKITPLLAKLPERKPDV